MEIRRSELDQAFLQYQAGAAAQGQAIGEHERAERETELLDRLVITRLIFQRATEADKARARARTDKLVAEARQQAGSEGSFRRQLLGVGFTPEDFDVQLFERATCEEVVERELRKKVTITDAQVREHYERNAERLRRPEMYRLRHLLLLTRDRATDQEYSSGEKQAKRQQMEKLLERARAGEDFAALIRAYSEDVDSKTNSGEYFLSRPELAPELAAALDGLQTNQLTGVVTTSLGYHLLQLLQRVPSEPIELSRIQEDLREKLLRDEMERRWLPDYERRLKEEAKLEYLQGTRPPPVKPAANPPPSP